MSFATTDDGVNLFFETAGTGTPIIFVHEFGGSHWSWEPQLNYFSRRHRCITFAARGYPPSEIPADVEQYSQERAADDVIAVLDATGVERAHVIGLSMGGFAALHVALRNPERVLSVLAAGTGYGAEKEHEEYFRGISEQVAKNFSERGSKEFGPRYAGGASRVQFQNKDPRGWSLFAERLSQHDEVGASNTMRGVQMRRPSLYDLEDDFRVLDVPVLVMTGDEDDHCIQPGLFLKRTIPRCGFAVLPKSGHTLNLEEPELFNRMAAEFIAQVEAGRWGPRDPRADASQIMRTD